MSARRGGTIGAVLLLVLSACGKSATPPPAAEAHPASDQFVGTDACRPCHAEIASTFARTGMGRSWYPMAGAPVIEDWKKKTNAAGYPADKILANYLALTDKYEKLRAANGYPWKR